jgi:hypothetical protein
MNHHQIAGLIVLVLFGLLGLAVLLASLNPPRRQDWYYCRDCGYYVDLNGHHADLPNLTWADKLHPQHGRGICCNCRETGKAVSEIERQWQDGGLTT